MTIADRFRNWARAKFANPGGQVGMIEREANPMGPWSGLSQMFLPNAVNPWLYEALRRAVPPLDGGIDALISLDGIIRVEGENDALVREIRDWLETVPVNDAQEGLQALYAGLGNEAYEQGFAIAEWIPDRRRRDIVGLRIADSKAVRFTREPEGLATWYLPLGHPIKQRDDGIADVERVIRGTATGSAITGNRLLAAGFTRLSPELLLYTVHAPEADNPYGTSKLRSVEFVSQILLTIQNSTKLTWNAFGDPPLGVTYTTNNPKASDKKVLEERRDAIAANIARVMEAKRLGNSAQFVHALGKDDAIKIEVIGAGGHVLELEMPARHMLEQILAKFRLASWMMGFQWNTSDRASDGQVELALGDAKVRWESRRPQLKRLVATMLRLRGRAWKPDDWDLFQETPNLRDVMKTAQAEFLKAQTAMMLAQSGAYAEGIDAAALPGQDPMGGGQRKALTAERIKAIAARVVELGIDNADELEVFITAELAK